MTNVQNARGQEEKSLIENIISLFQQLSSMQENQTPTEEIPMVEEAMMPDETDEEKMREMDINKLAEGETGDYDAETRFEEVTPTTDTSLEDLNKSIQSLISTLQGNKIQKTQVVKKDNNAIALGQIAKVLKNIVEKQQAQENLNTQLFEALGFSEDVIKKSLQKDEPVKKNRPIQNIDTTEVISNVITEVMKNIPSLNQNEAYRHPFNQKKDVRKGLSDIVKYVGESHRKK